MSWPRYNVVLYQPEIPQNTGNIARTCVATQAKLWIVRPAGFRLDDRHLRRSGLDYWRHLQWTTVDDWNDLLRQAGQRSIWYFSKAGRRTYTDIRYAPDDFLVFGSETNGLPRELLSKLPERTVRIPTTDQVRSLNLSNAVAIALYEAIRQTNCFGRADTNP